MSLRELPPSWRRDFLDAAPIGHLLRVALPDRWCRIHSLPESKRYAETEAETQEVLRRTATVAADVLGDAPCLLFRATYHEEPMDGMLSIPSAHEDGGAWALSAEPVRWDADTFEPLLREVADDQAGPVLFYAIDRARAFSPYDGGADLFFESELARDAHRQRYADWLSSHPMGL